MSNKKSYYLELREKVGQDLLVYPGALGAIINDKNEVLLVKKRATKLWGFPGGGVEPTETIHEALRREIKEETSCEIEIGKLIAIYSTPKFDTTYPNGDKIHPITMLFTCTMTSQEPFQPSEEIEAIRYFPQSSLPSMRECCIRKMHDVFVFSDTVIID